MNGNWNQDKATLVKRRAVAQQILTLLASRGASVSLGQAVEVGDINFLKSALKAGTDVNAVLPGYAHENALQLAVRTGSLEMVDLLLHRGAKANVYPANTQSPLSSAILQGNREITQRLLLQGPDINTPKELSRSLVAAIYSMPIWWGS